MLGTAFRRQMMMDGNMNSISFICTKTDSIRAEEVVNSLGADGICARTATDPAVFQALDDELMAATDDEEAKRRAYAGARRVRAGLCNHMSAFCVLLELQAVCQLVSGSRLECLPNRDRASCRSG